MNAAVVCAVALAMLALERFNVGGTDQVVAIGFGSRGDINDDRRGYEIVERQFLGGHTALGEVNG